MLDAGLGEARKDVQHFVVFEAREKIVLPSLESLDPVILAEAWELFHAFPLAVGLSSQ
jgi:hypothetical protein